MFCERPFQRHSTSAFRGESSLSHSLSQSFLLAIFALTLSSRGSNSSMWRQPLMHLFFILILITFVAIRHSASVFVPGEKVDAWSEDNPGWAQGDAAVADKSQMAIDDLRNLWQRTMILKEWMVEYQAASWESLFAPRGAASDLLDARFHVANAEVFGAATSEIQKAESELERADRDLQTALPLVTASMLPALNAIRKELSDAKLQLENLEPGTATADEQIKADLDQAIASLHGERP